MGVARAFVRSLMLVAFCAFALAGCGSSEPSYDYEPPQTGRAAPSASLFPDASGRSLRQVLKTADVPIGALGLRLEPTAMVFNQGRNRYPILVLASYETPVDNVDVALYLSKVPTSRSNAASAARTSRSKKVSGLDSFARGPFPARVETLATKPRFRARSTAEDPSSATVVYTSTLEFPTAGDWRVAAIVRDGQETASVILPSVSVGEFKRFPKVGQRAPLIHTSTLTSQEGDLGALSTRRPPSRMNQVDFAKALGKQPILLVFASPAFSWNHSAGPTLDVVEQVRHRFKDQAAFINVEPYRNNDPAEGVRSQVRAYRLPTELWIFAIDRHGRIVKEAEGPVGVAELTALVKGAIGS